jgi:hypothetical protein
MTTAMQAGLNLCRHGDNGVMNTDVTALVTSSSGPSHPTLPDCQPLGAPHEFFLTMVAPSRNHPIKRVFTVNFQPQTNMNSRHH